MCNYGANIRIIPETCKHFGNYFDYGDGDRGGSDHPWPLLSLGGDYLFSLLGLNIFGLLHTI